MPTKQHPPECERCGEPSTQTIARYDYTHPLCDGCVRWFQRELEQLNSHDNQPCNRRARVRLFRDANGDDCIYIENVTGEAYKLLGKIDLRDHRDPYERDRPKTRRKRDAPPHAHKPPPARARKGR